PETMTPMSFDFARGRTPVAPVTTRTTKLFRIMKLKDFSVWMAYKRARERIFFSVCSDEARGRDVDRFANARVTHLTTIDDVVSIDTDLMAKDRIIVAGHLRLQAFDLGWPKTD